MENRFKFRAWDNIRKTMDYNVDVIDGKPFYFHMEFIQYEDAVLMQCTGLTDKNGKDIYEGDLLSSYGNYLLEVKHSIVLYEGGYPTSGFGLFFYNEKERSHGDQLEDYHLNYSDYEIVGNIYEGKK